MGVKFICLSYLTKVTVITLHERGVLSYDIKESQRIQGKAHTLSENLFDKYNIGSNK